MTSNEVRSIIKKLENDKQTLKKISEQLKEVGETIINYSVFFSDLSDLLFEGFNISGKRIDDKMPEYVNEYKKYGDELLCLTEVIDNTELVKIEHEIINKRRLYNELFNEEKINDRLNIGK